MGSVFAIQVRTGFELKAKEMLEHVIKQASDTLIKGIYALETYTEVINKNSETIKVKSTVDKEDISSHLRRQELRASITNRRRQLEAIRKYNTKKYIELQNNYKKEINQLEKEFVKIGRATKRISSVMSGYILVELVPKSTFLPNHIWQLINKVPLVSSILSTDPIPDEEMRAFAKELKYALEPQVEIQLEKEMDYEEIQEFQSEALAQINDKSEDINNVRDLLNKIDEKKTSTIDKIRRLIDNKKHNPLLEKIKVFIKRKTETVTMPLRYLEKLYTDNELSFVGERISAKDFLIRLQQMSGDKEVRE